jgi:hypothetical protein
MLVSFSSIVTVIELVSMSAYSADRAAEAKVRETVAQDAMSDWGNCARIKEVTFSGRREPAAETLRRGVVGSGGC